MCSSATLRSFSARSALPRLPRRYSSGSKKPSACSSAMEPSPFACSNRLLWHGCEAKPYAVDVLAASAILAVFCWTQSWPVRRQLLVYLPLAPLLIFLCYPGAFLCGGILLALWPAVRRDNRTGT